MHRHRKYVSTRPPPTLDIDGAGERESELRQRGRRRGSHRLIIVAEVVSRHPLYLLSIMASPLSATPQFPVSDSSTSAEHSPSCLKPHILFGDEITDDQFVQCASLFSNNYGVWGPKAPAPLKSGVYSSKFKPPIFSVFSAVSTGVRVKMQPKKLRAECIGSGDPQNSVLSLMYKDGRLVGQAFATKWSVGSGMSTFAPRHHPS